MGHRLFVNRYITVSFRQRDVQDGVVKVRLRRDCDVGRTNDVRRCCVCKKQAKQFLQQMYLKKCTSSIRCWDMNTHPSECRSPPITRAPAQQVQTFQIGSAYQSHQMQDHGDKLIKTQSNIHAQMRTDYVMFQFKFDGMFVSKMSLHQFQLFGFSIKFFILLKPYAHWGDFLQFWSGIITYKMSF